MGTACSCCASTPDPETERLISEKPESASSGSRSSYQQVHVVAVVMEEDDEAEEDDDEEDGDEEEEKEEEEEEEEEEGDDDDDEELAAALHEARQVRQEEERKREEREEREAQQQRRESARLAEVQRREARRVQSTTRVQALVRRRLAQTRAKLLRKRQMIANEIVTSEQKYVSMLVECIKHFFPLRNTLDIQTIEALGFNGLYSLMEFNEEFLKELLSNRGWRIGKIFLEFDFKAYTSYINNSGDAMKLVYQIREKKAFAHFWEKLKEGHPDVHELAAYLILPIQRLPRYCLLLEDLLKYTPADHKDYADLLAAVGKMRDTADYLNEQKRAAENVARIEALRLGISKLPADFNPGTALKAENEFRWLNSKEKTKKKRVTLFLFEKKLLIVKHKKSLRKLLQRPASFYNRGLPQGNSFSGVFVALLPLHDLSADVDDEGQTLTLRMGSANYVLQSDQENLANTWREALKL